MTIDERVGRALAGMTEDLVPAPDPYGRVRQGHRRRQRRRLVAAGLSVVAVAAAGAVAATGSGGPAPVRPAENKVDRYWRNMYAWTGRLAASPPRGRVAQDPGYVATVASLVLRAQVEGKLDWHEPMTAARVLFIDDVGDRRIGLVALARRDPAPKQWPYASLWLDAPRGADAATLARIDPDMSRNDALLPMAIQGFGEEMMPSTHVAVAAAGCAFEIAGGPTFDQWKPEPTGSYLVRTAERAQWWRIVCDGVVRQTMPAPGSLIGRDITDAQLTEAMSGSRGRPDRTHARYAINGAASSWGYGITAIPRVVWTGRIEGAEPQAGLDYDGRATAVAAPAVGGGWVGEVMITEDIADPAGSSKMIQATFHSATDPTDRSAVLAVPVGDDTGNLLVIAPTGAKQVQLVHGDRVVATLPVRDGAAFTVRRGQFTLRALDGTGKVLATGAIADRSGGGVHGEDAWGED